MVKGIRANFKKSYSDLTCPLKCDNIHEDTQENLLTCSKLRYLSESVNYNDLFCSNTDKQLSATKVYIKILKKREEILGQNQALAPVN